MCSPEYEVSEDTTPQEEIDRVSKRHLLQLAQVSSFWYNIVMGTSKLWSTIVLDTSLWRHCTVSPDILLSLLDSCLKRGGNHPLTMEIGVLRKDPHPQPVFELLSQHAWRWHDVYFWSDLDSSKYLTNAKGNLHRLKKLHVSAEWKGVDIFQVAPLLKEIIFTGEVENVPDLPWDQIHSLTYIGEAYMDPFNCCSLLVYAANVVTALFDVDLSDAPFDAPWQLVSSNAQSITFELAVTEMHVISRMFDSLTLPCLKSFAFTPRPDDGPPIWETESFLSLAERSSFERRLTRLEITAIITDKDLLRCLSVLPQLQELVISDSSDDHQNALITDALLQGLVHKPGNPALIPRLDFLSLTSLLAYTDSSFVDVVTLRLEDMKDLDPVFEVHLWWLPARKREVSPEMLTHLMDLDSRGELVFDAGTS